MDVEKIYKIKNVFLKGPEYTKQPIVQKIYQMLSDIDKLFSHHHIIYWISFGTLLGAIRHGGLIPWDDDADLEILRKDEQKLLSIDYEKYGYKIIKMYFGYKIYPINGKKIKGYEWNYPFVDIFISDISNNKTFFVNEKQQSYDPNCNFQTNELFPLKIYKFGNIYLKGPRNSDNYLNKCYGSDWHSHYYKSYDHQNEKEIKPEKLKITDYSPVLPDLPLKNISFF
jgi:lipopolysaccharide cholinephosphotransferase